MSIPIDFGVSFEGKHTYKDFGLVMTEYIPGTPEVQSHYLEVIGRDGLLDITDAYGEVKYYNREYSWSFIDISDYSERPRKLMQLFNYLHGRSFQIVIDDDIDYYLTGRIQCRYNDHIPNYTTLEVVADCQPYRTRDSYKFYINASGGIWITFPSGRQPQCPIFESDQEIFISYEGGNAWIPSGAYQDPNLWFHEGDNRVFINSTPHSSNITYEELSKHTYAEISEKPMYEWYLNGQEPVAPLTYGQLENYTYEEIAQRRMIEWRFPASDDPRFNVYVKYDWRDL